MLVSTHATTKMVVQEVAVVLLLLASITIFLR